jgi:hypothetical protein
MNKSFNSKLLAKLYAKYDYVKTLLLTKNIQYLNYSFIFKYPEKKWYISKSLTLKNK